MWLKLKIRLQQRVEVLNTADKLSAAMKDIWENLTVDYIQGLYHSIPKCLHKSIEGEGRNDKVLTKGKHLFHKFIGFFINAKLDA